MNYHTYGLGLVTLDNNSEEHDTNSPKWFTMILNMAVPTVSPVDCATPYKAVIKHEFDTKDSHLRVDDNSSKRFAVNKCSALVADLVSEKNKSSK